MVLWHWLQAAHDVGANSCWLTDNDRIQLIRRCPRLLLFYIQRDNAWAHRAWSCVTTRNCLPEDDKAEAISIPESGTDWQVHISIVLVASCSNTKKTIWSVIGLFVATMSFILLLLECCEVIVSPCGGGFVVLRYASLYAGQS